MNAAYLRIGCQNDCCEGFTALFDQLMTGSKLVSETLLFSCTQQYLWNWIPIYAFHVFKVIDFLDLLIMHIHNIGAVQVSPAFCDNCP